MKTSFALLGFMAISAWAQDPVDRLVDFLGQHARSANPVQSLIADRGIHIETLRELLVPFGYQGNARSLEARIFRLNQVPGSVFCCASPPTNEGVYVVREIPPVVEYLLNNKVRTDDIQRAAVFTLQRDSTLLALETKNKNPRIGSKIFFLNSADSQASDALLDFRLNTLEQNGHQQIFLDGNIPKDHPAMVFGVPNEGLIEIKAPTQFGLPSKANVRAMLRSPAALQHLVHGAQNDSRAESIAELFVKFGSPFPEDSLRGINLTLASDVAAMWLEQSLNQRPIATRALEQLKIYGGEPFFREAMVNAALLSPSPKVQEAAAQRVGGVIQARIEALSHPSESVAWRAVEQLHERDIPIPGEKQKDLERLATQYNGDHSDRRIRLIMDLIGRIGPCSKRLADAAAKTHAVHSQPKDD